MPITFGCKCGQQYNVPDTFAGRELRCPACEAVLVVPATSAIGELVPDADEAEEEPGTTYGLADNRHPTVDDEPDIVDENPDVVEEFADDDAGDPEYFVAANPAKAYRLYPYGDELLVLHAGPFRWSLAGVLASRSGLGKASARTAADESAREALARRAAALDRLTLDELRAEADAHPESCRVTADNTSMARIGPPAARGPADRKKEPAIAGRVTFRHASTGTWDLVLLTKADARMAARAFRRVLGPENVDVASGPVDGRG